ncbi:MATE family efflux transporter [Streptococcus oriscaviae]|uniref:Probable multidrug resistance protein NorM n=1 Tax=Streptococcus oriscaviae TaxID=2781599 RepID=A0ABX7YJW9_9STRE|nr:MATE family efflux transporter [Streptococcus oriscaviae]QUE54000.1 MATE family efflux transporter [Streptococcus oriscaviae]
MKKRYKDILQIALPAMVENMLQMLMGMVDSYLVAFLGLVALSGVSVANNVLAIYQAIFIALGAALSAYLGQTVGKKDQALLSQQLTEGVKLTLLLSLILGVLSILLGPNLLLWMGAEKEVAEAGGLYLVLVGGAVGCLGFMTSLGAILRATGRVRLPMYVSLLSNLLNALLSALAVFVLKAGIAGVAWGTILSRLIGCLILWYFVKIPLGKPSWKLDRQLLRLALPAAGERLMMRLGDLVVVGMIVSLGTAVVAGNSIGETLTQFNYMPGLGLATATIILTAQEKGRADWREIRALGRASLFLALLSMGLVGLLIFVGRQPLLALYTTDAQATTAGQLVILFCLIGLPATAATLIFTALWQGLGNAKLPLYATTIGMWLVRIVGAYILLTVFQLGLAAIWIGTIVDNVFRAVFLSLCFRRELRKHGEGLLN